MARQADLLNRQHTAEDRPRSTESSTICQSSVKVRRDSRNFHSDLTKPSTYQSNSILYLYDEEGSRNASAADVRKHMHITNPTAGSTWIGVTQPTSCLGSAWTVTQPSMERTAHISSSECLYRLYPRELSARAPTRFPGNGYGLSNGSVAIVVSSPYKL